MNAIFLFSSPSDEFPRQVKIRRRDESSAMSVEIMKQAWRPQGETGERNVSVFTDNDDNNNLNNDDDNRGL